MDLGGIQGQDVCRPGAALDPLFHGSPAPIDKYCSYPGGLGGWVDGWMDRWIGG